MNKVNKFCQSCGMPMSKDPQGGGTEKDGTKSLKFCNSEHSRDFVNFTDFQIIA